MNLANIVTVNISLATAQVTGTAFGRALIYGHSGRFTAQTGRVYQASSWAASMLGDGFLVGDLEYIMAAAYFSQTPAPPDVMVAQLAANVAQIATLTPVYADNTTYSVTLNGTVFTYSTTTGGSATTIVTGLKAAMGSPANVALTGSTTLIITSSTAGLPFTVSCTVTAGAGTIAAVATTANLGPQENLTALVTKGYGSFYAICLAVAAAEFSVDNRQAAIWTEAQAVRRIYLGTTNDVNSYNSGSTTDDMYVFKAASYTRSALIYDAGTNPGTHAAAWLGAMLATVPGSTNWAYKGLVGETPEALTDAQTAAILAKYGSFYVNVSGSSFTFAGNDPNGSWIDATVGNDWVANTMQVNLATLLLTQPKVSFDDGGIAQIGATLQAVLNQAVANGIYTSNPKPVLTLPRASGFTSSQRQTRSLTGVSWVAQMAGAINGITVNANLTF